MEIRSRRTSTTALLVAIAAANLLGCEDDGNDVSSAEWAASEGKSLSGMGHAPVFGVLDPTLNNSGIVTTSFGGANEQANAVAIQADGKILVAGTAGFPSLYYADLNWNMAVARYEPGGALDATFGTGGRVTVDIRGGYEEAWAVADQADGKIVLGGSADTVAELGGPQFTLVRLDASGTLDGTFGTGGRATTHFGSPLSLAFGMAFQPDGKILLAGYALESWESYKSNVALARFNADGSLDAGFGEDGRKVIRIGDFDDLGFALELQQDGKIIVVGTTHRSATEHDLLVLRLETDGSPDRSFGRDGVVTTFSELGNGDFDAVAVQADGRIVCAGTILNGPGVDIALVRYDDAGHLDGSFGTGGIVTTHQGAGSLATSLALQADGRIVIGGSVGDDFAVLRYKKNGLLDASFGDHGITITDLSGRMDHAAAMALQEDGRIVLVGSTGVNPERTTSIFAMVRYR